MLIMIMITHLLTTCLPCVIKTNGFNNTSFSLSVPTDVFVAVSLPSVRRME